MTEEELDEVIEASPVPTELQVTSAHGQDMGADIVDKICELKFPWSWKSLLKVIWSDVLSIAWTFIWNSVNCKKQNFDL